MHVISYERDTQFVLSLRACSCILMHAAPDHYMYAIAKKKTALINVISMLRHMQLPISTGVPRLPWSVPLDRSRSPRSAIKSRVLMHAYATRGLGFLVRCATISRQLGQGRLRSGGSPLFMINHMLLAVLPTTTEGLEVWSFQLITRARQSMCFVRTLHARTQTRVFSLEEREVKLSPTGD